MTAQYIKNTIVSTKSICERVETCSELFLKLEQEKKPGASLRQIAKATEEIWFTERIRIEDSLSDLSGMISSLLNHEEDNKPVDEKEEEKEADIKFLISRYRSFAQGIIDLNSDKGLSENEYYEHVWKNLSLMLGEASEDEKGCCLYAILLDKRTPYFKVSPGMRMSNADYQKEMKRLSDDIDKAQFILNLKTKQKTETASQLLELIENVNSKEGQVVLLSRILAIVQKKKRDEDDD